MPVFVFIIKVILITCFFISAANILKNFDTCGVSCLFCVFYKGDKTKRIKVE